MNEGKTRVKEAERILKALANKRRLAIVSYLRKKPRSIVGDIAEDIQLSFKATSKHLTILLAAEIVEREQESLNMYYHLVEPMRPITKVTLANL